MAEVTSKLETIVIPEEGNALYKAFQMIAQVLGINFKYPTIYPKDPEEVCEISGVRCRQVYLRRQWWKENRGPLLAFYRENRDPLVLIYTKDGMYEIFDPKSNHHIPLKAEHLKQIVPYAYSFYVPLPEGEYTFPKLLSWGLRGQSAEVVSLITAGCFAVIVAFFFPFSIKILFDYVVRDYNLSLFIQITIGLILAAIAVGIFQFARSYIILRIDGILQHRFQVSLWDRLLKLPVSFFRQFGSGDYLQRTLLFDQFRRVLSEGTLRIVLNGIFSLLFIVIMFIFSWKLTFIAITIAFIATILTFIFFIHNVKLEDKVFQAGSTINSFLTQIVNGITKIRIANAEWNIFSLWSRDYDQYIRLALKSRAVQNRVITINTFLENTSIVLIFGAVIWMISRTPYKPGEAQSVISLGTFMGFFLAFFLFNNAVFDALNTLCHCVGLVPFWSRTKTIFTTEPEISSEKVDPGILKGNIHVENVTFHYQGNGAIILDELNLDIQAGEFIGITGSSGSGKSSLARLLIAFETPTEGSIFYDNKDLSGLDPHRLRKQMGIILQNSSIFAGTILDNITCGSAFSSDQVTKALQVSTLDQDIAGLPMGLETILPSNGGILSLGQRQRLLLARVFIRDPKILILDEALFALDPASLEKVLTYIKGLPITRLLITQRSDILKQADRIITLSKG